MPFNNLSDEEEEALRFENEFLKLKIKAQTGAIDVSANPSGDTPPEVENEILKFMANCDESKIDFDEIPIYDFIGKPEFVKEEELNDEQLEVELERVTDLLYEKNIVFDTVYPVGFRDLYKFLTEDLFQHKIVNNFVEGWGSHYFYEDFHPNHNEDSKAACIELLSAFFDDKFNFLTLDFSEEKIINFEELIKFRNLFCEFRNVEYEILDTEVNTDECVRIGTISFDAISSPGIKPIHYSGETLFQLEYKDESWTVISVILPGIVRDKN